MKKSCQTISNRKIFFKSTYYQQITMLRLSYKNLNKRYDYCLITQFFISRCYVFKRWSFFDLKGFRGLSSPYFLLTFSLLSPYFLLTFPLPSPYFPLTFPLLSPYLPLIFPLSSPYLPLIFPYLPLSFSQPSLKVRKGR